MIKISRKKYWSFVSIGIILGTIFLSCFAIAQQLLSSSSLLTDPYGRFPKISPTQKVSATETAPATPKAPTSPSGSGGVPILMYHYVGNNPNPADRQRDILSITSEKLDAQFNWLATNGYTPITLDTLYGIFAGQEKITKPVVLTFDDGYVDFYYNAFQILSKYNFHAVSFIPTGFVGQPAYMSWEQIREIKNSGLVSFEAHSVTHPNLTSLPLSQMKTELIESKKTLEQQLGIRVNFVAYPFGVTNSLVAQEALAAGFVGGVGTWDGKAAGPGINMPRIRITGTLSLGDFVSRLLNN